MPDQLAVDLLNNGETVLRDASGETDKRRKDSGCCLMLV